jgi:lipid A 3-O-deacylase
MDIRLVVIAGIAGLALAGPAAAQSQSDDAADGWGGSLTVENDMFVPGLDGTDRYFTQGLRATLLLPEGEGPLAPLVNRWLPGAEGDSKWRFRQTFSLGQNMYTPEDKVRFDPAPGDRPYAGWLYLSTATVAYSERQMASLELQLGVVGPAALAGRTQNWWHRVIDAPSVNGWDHELHNEPGLNLYGEWRRRLTADPEDGWGGDIIGVGTAALGNVETSAGLGGDGAGRLQSGRRLRAAPAAPGGGGDRVLRRRRLVRAGLRRGAWAAGRPRYLPGRQHLPGQPVGGQGDLRARADGGGWSCGSPTGG